MSTENSDSTLEKVGLVPSHITFPPLDHDSVNGAPAHKRDVSEILLSFVVLSIPLSVLAAVLVGLVVHFRLPTSSLSSDQPLDPKSYYVNLSATRIALIASYSSTVISLVIGSAMVLVSYPLAAMFVRYSQNKDLKHLPTPYQVGLLVNLRTGSVKALWPWFKYTFRRLRKHTSAVVKASVMAVLLALLLSVLVTLGDTWLHLSIESKQVARLTLNLVSRSNFGRGLCEYCNQKNSFYNDSTVGTTLPCSLDRLLGRLYLIGGDESYKTLNNVSTTNRLLTGHDSTGTSYVFLGDARATTSQVDFTASTFAMSSQCQIISQQCGLLTVGPAVRFNCSSSFSGDLGSSLSTVGANAGTVVRIGHFNDPELTIGQPPKYPGGANPMFVAIAAYVNDVGVRLPENGTKELFDLPLPSNDSVNFQVSQLLGIAYIMRCNVTLYDAVYTWTNGSFNNFTTLTPSNSSMSAIVNGPLQQNATFGNSIFLSNVMLASTSNTTQQALDSIAYVYSSTALGLASGILRSRENLEEFTREGLIVAQVPYAPFYTLVALDLLYALVGLVLAVAALAKGDYVGGSLVTVWGVVAHAFEKTPAHGDIRTINNLFQETRDGTSDVVGIERDTARGVWQFKTYTDKE